MEIGLHITAYDWPGGPEQIAPRLIEVGRAADDAGFASISVMDHVFQIEMIGPAEEPMLESYSALNLLAASTSRARLGTVVSGVVYRHPGLLIKQVTALDVLSGGRAFLGVGAAWYEREARGLGLPFPPLKERFDRLEETLQIAHQMWSGSAEPYAGKHYQLAEPLNSPAPISHPHPPILIGGGGETKTLRLVAKYGDACNLYTHLGPDGIRSKLAILRRHCDEAGRAYDAIERTATGPVDVSDTPVDEIIRQCRDLAGAGIQRVLFFLPGAPDLRSVETFGREIIPAAAGF